MMKMSVDTSGFDAFRRARSDKADAELKKIIGDTLPFFARWAARYSPPNIRSRAKEKQAQIGPGYWQSSKSFGHFEPGQTRSGRHVAAKYFKGDEIEPVLYYRKYVYLPKLAGNTSNGAFRKRIKAEMDKGNLYAVIVDLYGHSTQWVFLKTRDQVEQHRRIKMRGIGKAAWGMGLTAMKPSRRMPGNIRQLVENGAPWLMQRQMDGRTSVTEIRQWGKCNYSATIINRAFQGSTGQIREIVLRQAGGKTEAYMRNRMIRALREGKI